MKNRLTLLLLCLVAAPGIGFSQGREPIEQLVKSYNAFGFKLLAQTRQAAPQKNVFVSPTGLAFVLSMAADGAGGRTLSQMRNVLEIPSAFDLKGANLHLLDLLLTNEPGIKLEIANSLWVAQDATLKAPFSSDMEQYYKAESASVDFKNPVTAKRINRWVDQATHGKIPTMVEPPLDNNRLILLDAIYFKGDWLTPFDRKLTQDKPFTLADGKTATVPLMLRSGKMEYFEDETCQAVRLPYVGHDLSMDIFLPKNSLNRFLQQHTLPSWRDDLTRFRSRKGTLELPRFKLDNKYDLKDILRVLGMPEAFSNKANFSGISDERLHIDSVKQKTYVDVNEEGTEAAAVSGITMVGSAMHREEPPFQMIVDRPFFLAIHENDHGDILFLGAIVDPRN